MAGEKDGLRVAVLGATGAVGTELLRLLETRDFPVAGEPVVLASARSAGRTVRWRDGEVTVREVSAEAFDGVDVALFSAGATRSREWAPVAAAAGAVVIDNSSAYRGDPDVPLVVAEVNPDAAAERPKGIIANPNCTTMTLMVPVKPLHDAFGLEAMVATSYQAAGGIDLVHLQNLLSFAEQECRLLEAAFDDAVGSEDLARRLDDVVASMSQQSSLGAAWDRLELVASAASRSQLVTLAAPVVLAVLARISSAISAAQARGLVRPDVPARALARFLWAAPLGFVLGEVVGVEWHELHELGRRTSRTWIVPGVTQHRAESPRA